MLTLEDPGERSAIIAWAMRELGITLKEVAAEMDDTMCPRCHLRLPAHCEREGHCDE
jgi:hypothetical protein